MISKGKFRWLRSRYRAIVIQKRQVQNLAWQWEADAMTQPKLDADMKERLLDVFRKHFSGDRMEMLKGLILGGCQKDVFYQHEPFDFHLTEPSKGTYSTYRVGKHRPPPKDGEKGYELNWDPAALDEPWGAYTRAVGKLGIEDMPLTSHYRTPKLIHQQMSEASEYAKFALAAALAARVSKVG